MEEKGQESYQSKYELEKEKVRKLSIHLGDQKAEAERLRLELERIKTSLFWRKTQTIRLMGQKSIHFFKKVKRYRNPKQLVRKLSSKRLEYKSMKYHGTKSFPSNEVALSQKNAKFSKDVQFSILVPLYNTPKKYLHEMIESVLAQTYENWQLCLADGSDNQHDYVGKICQEYGKNDPRISYHKLKKNEGISENTNACYKLATGEYIGLFDHDDILHPSVLYEYAKVIEEKDANYIYCDEATFKKGNINRMITLHFKSDYAIDTLRANNYICHFSVFHRDLLKNEELFRKAFDGSQDHDMILRLTSKAKNIVHVPKILYYWRSHKNSVASSIGAKSYAIEAARNAVLDHLKVFGFKGAQVVNTRAFETIFRIKYELNAEAKVSIIIPNKDSIADLKRCIDSILEKTLYDDYEIIVIENNSTTKEIFVYYEELKKKNKIKVERYQDKFNYAKINNFATSFATGKYLLFLNNDTKVISPNWIEELLMYAQREDVGAVGAKLYYPDMTIQHAGIVIGLGQHRSAGHTYYGVDYENLGYMGKLCYAQNVSAVTGACLMVEKEQFHEVGGFEESLTVSLNDVDFCLKLREKGYLNVFNPYCELFHYESKSRGLDNSGEKAKRYQEEVDIFRIRWKKLLDEGDPYYNVNFSLDRSDYALRI